MTSRDVEVGLTRRLREPNGRSLQGNLHKLWVDKAAGMMDSEQDALERRVDALERRVRALERAEADLDIRLTTHRAIITQVALVEIAKLTGLTQEDWEEALDDFAEHIQRLREADESDEARRQFEVILSEVEAFRNRKEDRPAPVFRVNPGGKKDP